MPTYTYYFPDYKTGTSVAIQAPSVTIAKQQAQQKGLGTNEVLPGWRGTPQAPAVSKSAVAPGSQQVPASIEQAVAAVTKQVQDLTQKIKTEGVTDAGGKYLIKPEAPQAPGDGGAGGADFLKNNQDYQNLPQDMKDYLTEYYNILKTQDAEAQKKLNDALEQAKLQANPYWAEVINIAKDEVSRALGEKQGDFATQEKYLQEQISRIKTDLATKKGDLSIDEQAELARQTRRYEQELETTRENAAEAGLTFSSKRTQAESRLATEQQDIVESTKTKYMREARDLDLAVQRGEADAIAKLAEYKRILGEQQTSILRQAESKLGTANLPDFSKYAGIAPLGGVRGSLEEEKIKDIYQRAEALAGLGNPFLR